MKASSEHNRDDSAAEDEAVLESELNDLFSEEEEDGDVVANVKTPTCDYDMDPRLVEHIHAAHGLEPGATELSQDDATLGPLYIPGTGSSADCAGSDVCVQACIV